MTFGESFLAAPHRLDLPVTGGLLLALNPTAARRISRQFRDRLAKKTYWGIVQQPPDPPVGNWIDWLIETGNSSRAIVSRRFSRSGREAILRYRVMGRVNGGWLVEFEPVTGRFHQIRAQLANRGLPIIGDRPHGSRVPFFRLDVEDWEMPRIALHARRLEYFHPSTGRIVTVTAPLPWHWREFEIEDSMTQR